MTSYILRRLLILPLTLFCILLVNFVIINLAPGDPVSETSVSERGDAERKKGVSGDAERYLLFRERFGLTLPILINTWPWIDIETMEEEVAVLTYRKRGGKEISFKEWRDLKRLLGDQARFQMPNLLRIANRPRWPLPERKTALELLIRGGTRIIHLGPNLTTEQQRENEQISSDNIFLRELSPLPDDDLETINAKVAKISRWFHEPRVMDRYDIGEGERYSVLFFETRFFRYFSSVLTLDFGTLRDDNNKTVISEVLSRFKYSLTLSLIPMLITFFLCMILGLMMAMNHERFLDHGLNLTCLILYAIPIFVVAPFLIEKAIGKTFPFTDIPIPLSGFTSSYKIYSEETTLQRLFDIARHIALPILAIIYGMLAAQSRLARTAILEVKKQEYVRTAYAKGLSKGTIYWKYIGRNASITIVTALAGSLGVILGGSLIVETLFDINGFGKFFYDAILNRDYNVILFSVIAGSFLTLTGYLMADVAYTILDPRVTLE